MYKRIFLALFCLLTIGCFSTTFAQQAATGQTQTPNQEGVTISPPLVELNLTPGNIYKGKIKVTNPTEKIINLYPVVMNFGAKDETGAPGFTPAEDDSSTYAMAKWITFSQKKLALTPQQVAEFSYTINVPADAESGGHYGVIFFASQPPTLSGQTSQVAIASQVGVLVLGKVAGDIKEEAAVEQFSVNKKFYFITPVDFIARIKNNGNIHLKPSGDVIIKNMFGKEIGKVTVNDSKGNVLPQSIRKFELSWNQTTSPFYKIPIGRFTANLNLTYGENNQTLTSSTTFWIIPIWFMVVTSIVILLIIALIILQIRRKKDNNSSVEPNGKSVELEDKKEEIKIANYSEEKDDKEKTKGKKE